MIQEREQPATIPRKFIVSRLVWRFSGEEKERKSKRKSEGEGGKEGRWSDARKYQASLSQSIKREVQ